MNIISITTAAALLLTTLPSLAAVYECTDRKGNSTYTATGGANCRNVVLGRPNIYTPAPVSNNTNIATETPNEPEATDNSAINAAEKNLNDAKKALTDGKQVRYGNERNYVRYQERIQGLENEVAKRQSELNQARSGDTPAAAPSPNSPTETKSY